MPNLSKTEQLIIALLVPFYLIGALLHLFEATLPAMLKFTPYTILLTSTLGFFFEVKERNHSVLLWALLTFLVTLFLEIVGVATSLVFGAYQYGNTLGFAILGVPALIGINWTIIILGLSSVIGKRIERPVVGALLTASLTVIFDYVMEPVAIAFDYWSWEIGTIPLQNYIAWFVIAFVFSYLFLQRKLKSTNSVATIIVVVQFFFFLILRLFAV
ncbi:MAG: carotenoid biosynthesis protein [Spirochaetia bacterium]|nr:carotenoid biosynthesis protein [Spirochaetia bacterium]